MGSSIKGYFLEFPDWPPWLTSLIISVYGQWIWPLKLLCHFETAIQKDEPRLGSPPQHYLMTVVIRGGSTTEPTLKGGVLHDRGLEDQRQTSDQDMDDRKSTVRIDV